MSHSVYLRPSRLLCLPIVAVYRLHLASCTIHNNIRLLWIHIPHSTACIHLHYSIPHINRVVCAGGGGVIPRLGSCIRGKGEGTEVVVCRMRRAPAGEDTNSSGTSSDWSWAPIGIRIQWDSNARYGLCVFGSQLCSCHSWTTPGTCTSHFPRKGEFWPLWVSERCTDSGRIGSLGEVWLAVSIAFFRRIGSLGGPAPDLELWIVLAGGLAWCGGGIQIQGSWLWIMSLIKSLRVQFKYYFWNYCQVNAQRFLFDTYSPSIELKGQALE